MYGVRFLSDEGIGLVVSRILCDRKAAQYVWTVDCLWMEGPHEYAKNQAEGKILSTEELMEAFDDLKGGFLYFGRLRRYIPGAKVGEIETAQDFLESDCSMMILCVDAREYEVYGKNAEEIRRIFHGISKVKACGGIEMGSEQQIGRTRFTV